MPNPVVEPDQVSEKQIIKIWQHQLLDKTELATEEGELITIIYPGRINDDRGADFRDAVIATSRGLLNGDIEVHVKSSSWQAHRHHQNSAYNRVILHVAMWHDTKAVTNLQNGKSVPILALHKYISSPPSQSPNLAHPPATLTMPCLKSTEHLTAGIIAECLDTAGEERFLAKASRFEAGLAQMEASQCLYQGIMGALGYSKNKLPFLELARRLPLQALASAAQGNISEAECLTRQQALLLGTAGLLPSQRQSWHQENKLDDKWIGQLERLWTAYHQAKAISEDDWHLFKVRPNNFPPRRIAAMSYLVFRYQERGLFEEVVSLIKEVPLNKGCRRLEQGLVVTTSGYWANHFDFGLGGTHNPTLLGSQRAAEIAVNIILPVTFAWGKITSQPKLVSKVLNLYNSYPKLAVNGLERHMSKQLRLTSSLVNSARRQQGLIHIYTSLCTQGKCNCCPIGHHESGTRGSQTLPLLASITS
jgi:hypothetical protein